jgi:hypothetical protein
MIDWASMFSAMSDASPNECVAAFVPAAEDLEHARADGAVPRLMTGEDDDDADFWRLAGADDRSRPVIDFGLIDSGGGCLIGEPCDAPDVLLMELRGRYGRRLRWAAMRRRCGDIATPLVLLAQTVCITPPTGRDGVSSIPRGEGGDVSYGG